MAKRMGAIWVGETKEGEPYMTGTTDLGVIHREIQIVAWKNRDTKEAKQPDYVINLSEPKQEDQGQVAAIDIDGGNSPFPETKVDVGDEDVIDAKGIPF